MEVDYLVVGAGLTGITIAKNISVSGKSVMVVERRNKVGGNICDRVHPSGIRIHSYGPHYFRTNNIGLWNIMNLYGPFYTHKAVVKAWVDDSYQSWPVSNGIHSDGIPSDFEEACLMKMSSSNYYKFVKGYTEKQWGISADQLTPDLADRIDVNRNGNDYLKQHKFQGIPINGYSSLMENYSRGVSVILNMDYQEIRDKIKVKFLTFYSGSIDEYFKFCLGKLAYRCQEREMFYSPTIHSIHPFAQVNFPNWTDGNHIRIIEWKHMMPKEIAENINGTVLTRETPTNSLAPDYHEYPIPDNRNRMLYESYKRLADELEPNTVFCGRLGEYRYLDMDQAIENAQEIVRNSLCQ